MKYSYRPRTVRRETPVFESEGFSGLVAISVYRQVVWIGVAASNKIPRQPWRLRHLDLQTCAHLALVHRGLGSPDGLLLATTSRKNPDPTKTRPKQDKKTRLPIFEGWGYITNDILKVLCSFPLSSHTKWVICPKTCMFWSNWPVEKKKYIHHGAIKIPRDSRK